LGAALVIIFGAGLGATFTGALIKDFLAGILAGIMAFVFAPDFAAFFLAGAALLGLALIFFMFLRIPIRYDIKPIMKAENLTISSANSLTFMCIDIRLN
jgi:hypothetical protein